MDYITVEEFELLSFFETMPKQADPGIAWPYNDYTYNVEIGVFSINFGIAPAYKDLSFSIFHAGSEVYKFCALSVKDVLYHKQSDREVLEIVISDRDSIWLQLRPALSVSQYVKGGT